MRRGAKRGSKLLSMSQSTFDPGEFRKALGSFATGVTVITTRAPDGTPVGLTANSFNSVSLSPPLVLWSLARSSGALDIFRGARHWAVHVLSAAQEPLSSRFARRGEDKFAELELDEGPDGIPLLRDCTARFECRNSFQYEGGDHVIFVGEVLGFERRDDAPLVFHGGRYAHATARDSGGQPRLAHLAGSFNEDFLGYLLGRSHFQFFGQLRPHLVEAGLSDEAFYVLSTLTLKPMMFASDLDTGMAEVLDESHRDAVLTLVRQGMVQTRQSAAGLAYELTDAGRDCALRLISRAKSVESDVLERLGAADAVVLKSLLNRLLGVIDPGAAAIWESAGASSR